MKIIKLFLLLCFGLWADFKLDVTNENNKIFYKEVARVFVQPLYKPINTARFEDMNGSEMSLEMRESIEKFLPIYLNTKLPFTHRKENYPTTEIQRFFKVLNKYIGVLKLENRNSEIYQIYDKRLLDVSDCVKNASSLLDLLYGMMYYESVLNEKKYIDNHILMLLDEYKLPKKDYFFYVLEKDRQKGVDIFLKEIDKNEVSQEKGEELYRQFNNYTHDYYAKYGVKLKKIVHLNLPQSVNEYENYIDAEFKDIEKISTQAKILLSLTFSKLVNIFSKEKKSYETIVDYQAHVVTLLQFTTLSSTYYKYLQFLDKYKILLASQHKLLNKTF